MAVEIKPATIRDLSWIIANMRPDDRREVYCQIPKDTKAGEYAYCLNQLMETWVATYKGEPVLCFGVHPLSSAVLSVWAFGTSRATKAIPAMTRFMRDERGPQWIKDGFRRMEARSIEGHKQAHKWMISTGARRVCSLPDWGENGERFILFAWRAKDVHFPAKPAETAEGERTAKAA